MVNVLIPTKPDDEHALYVQLALERKGHRGILWYTGDFPSQQTHSFEVDQNSFCWSTNAAEGINNYHFDVVWFRRPLKPILPDSIHPEDKENARKENNMLFQSFWQVVAPNAVWINPIKTIASTNSKLLQLKIAANVGLKIPHTLISNDPSKIKNYIRKLNGVPVVYKPLYPVAWIKDSEVRLTYTSQISLDDLPQDLTIQSTPGIFQEKIEKAYEIRITYFGNQYIAVKLNSQEHPKGRMDWRFVPTHELRLEEIRIPRFVDQGCQELMKRFGIIFGCFDFIVTPDNEYYFLEINEQGQFLWIEDVNPAIKMLDSFVNFLIHLTGHQNKIDIETSMLEFKEEMENNMQIAKQRHKNVSFC